MPRKAQHELVALLGDMMPDVAFEEEAAPDWLVRPGRTEMRDLWPLAYRVYADLTGGLELPEVMRRVERRSLDAILTHPDGTQQVLEVDESQHFTGPRLLTLEAYGPEIQVAFDIADWRDRCRVRADKKQTGGWGAPKPPLFPGDGGRTRQRAFRDFLADLLPTRYGWLPTIRIAEDEAFTVLRSKEPSSDARVLLASKQP